MIDCDDSLYYTISSCSGVTDIDDQNRLFTKRCLTMKEHEKINYLELPAKDINAAKQFFSTVFNWSFVDYGSEYTVFSGAGVDGGFFTSDLVSSSNTGSALIVFYSNSLEQTEKKIEDAGGNIITPVFSFPGGRRFHFSDPNGNEYAVWTDDSASPIRE